MSEPRGSTAPTWNDTHPFRINNWVGSDSWVEGARRDAADTPQPPAGEPLFPYLLTEKAFVDGKIRQGGEIVWLHPSIIGPHHQKMPGVRYPDDKEEEAPPCPSEPSEPELF